MVQISASRQAPSPSKARLKQLEILGAASRAFRSKGLHATGMREIAAESGMHVGNLYYYFRNKQELLAFCQDETLKGLSELAESIRYQEWAADEKLYRLIVAQVVHLNDEMPGSLAHLEVEALSEPWRSEIVRRRDRYESAVRSLIEEGMETGAFRPGSAAVLAKAILGAVNWTVKWYQASGPRSSLEIGQEFAALMVRGLLAPEARPSIPELGGDEASKSKMSTGSQR